MRKLILTSLLLVLPASALAEGQVVVAKKDCHEQEVSYATVITCKGAIRNIGETDVKDVVVSITPSNGWRSEDSIDYLPAKEREEFKIVWRLPARDLRSYNRIRRGLASGAEVEITYQSVDK